MLCCGTYVVEQDQLVGPATVEVANGVEDTVPDERRSSCSMKRAKRPPLMMVRYRLWTLKGPFRLKAARFLMTSRPPRMMM